MSSLPYNSRLRARARELRNNSTLAEILLWNAVKRRQRLGFDFHRQKPILEWIADFYCAELKLVIEIDGETHRFKAGSDAAKESGFRSLGLSMLRFGDAEVKKNMAGVVAAIDRWIEDKTGRARSLREHTPAGQAGHPSEEGSSVGPATVENSPLERGGRTAPGCPKPARPNAP